MANNPGAWFDRNKAAPEDLAVMDQLVQHITVGQMDPSEVVKRYVELVEAEATELVNFVSVGYCRAHEQVDAGAMSA